MWTSNDFFRAARPILVMVDKGWFDDAVGRLDGCEVFRRLMMSGDPWWILTLDLALMVCLGQMNSGSESSI